MYGQPTKCTDNPTDLSGVRLDFCSDRNRPHGNSGSKFVRTREPTSPPIFRGPSPAQFSRGQLLLLPLHRHSRVLIRLSTRGFVVCQRSCTSDKVECHARMEFKRLVSWAPETRFANRGGSGMLHVRWKNMRDKGSKIGGTSS
jgi:hypothetical protein